jgi:murein DD-endopeptidase MepM/ murein hydrolase activator NlpD
MTRYAHASKILVERDQPVDRGVAVAQVGQTGTATAEHVHYEIWVGGRAMDPQNYILNGVIP